MPPLSLDLKDAITVVTGIVTIAGVIFALRNAVGKLELGQTEVLRQLGALHKRLDHHGQEIARLDKNSVRLDERVKALKESQAMRLRRSVAEGEQDMFAEEPEG